MGEEPDRTGAPDDARERDPAGGSGDRPGEDADDERLVDDLGDEFEGDLADERPPCVLVVEDETDVRELYAMRLRDEYEVRTAADGEEALERLDDDVDVVLLDRRMPGLHGDDTLDRIRESGTDVRVAAVTAVGADLDLVGLPVDSYIEKPVDTGQLRAVVDRLVRVSRYDDRVRRYYAATQKQATLDETGHTVAASPSYRELVRRREALERGLSDLRERLEDEDYDLLFREFDRGVGGRGDDGMDGDTEDPFE